MATSSIFHNIKIDTPQEAEAFVAALESSENDPWIRPTDSPKHVVETDPFVIRQLLELNRQTRENAK